MQLFVIFLKWELCGCQVVEFKLWFYNCSGRCQVNLASWKCSPAIVHLLSMPSPVRGKLNPEHKHSLVQISNYFLPPKTPGSPQMSCPHKGQTLVIIFFISPHRDCQLDEKKTQNLNCYQHILTRNKNKTIMKIQIKRIRKQCFILSLIKVYSENQEKF